MRFSYSSRRRPSRTRDDEYFVRFCGDCGRKQEHDSCTGNCVVCEMKPVKRAKAPARKV